MLTNPGRSRPLLLTSILVMLGALWLGYNLSLSTQAETQPTPPPSNDNTKSSSLPKPEFRSPPVPTSPLKLAPTEDCKLLDQQVLGPIENSGLYELSGLAVSPSQSDLLWAHNDSGTKTKLFGLGQSGQDRGAITVDGNAAEGYDIEDIAVAGEQLVLADVGDNNGARDAVALYLLDEPNAGDAPLSIGTMKTVRLTYPDGARDVEAVFVDPVDGSAYLVAKDQPAVDEGSLLFAFYQTKLDKPSTEAIPAGMVALPVLRNDESGDDEQALDVLATLLAPAMEAPTGADISQDGAIIAIRTYASVWIFQRNLDESMAEALISAPCRIGVPDERQGEAVAIVETRANANGTTDVVLLTASEGTNSVLTQTRVAVARR